MVGPEVSGRGRGRDGGTGLPFAPPGVEGGAMGSTEEDASAARRSDLTIRAAKREIECAPRAPAFDPSCSNPIRPGRSSLLTPLAL